MTVLRTRRLERGMSLTALAIAAQVQVSSLSRIERGQRCNQITAVRLAVALGVPVRDVFVDYDRLRNF